MPIPVKIKEKIVILDDENIKQVMLLLDEAMKNQDLSSDAEVAASQERTREGWWVRCIVTPIEKVTGESHGAKERVLRSFTVKLDPPANLLRKGYIACLNDKLILANNLTSKDTNTEQT